MQISQNVSLKHFNTFGMESVASHFATLKTNEDLEELVKTSTFKQNKRLILGGGSNLLFTGNFDGIVIKNEIKGLDVVEEDESYAYLKIGAGEVWHDVVLYSLQQGLSGIENLSLIPGTAGAAPMQNIGAYGVEIKDVFTSLEAYNFTSEQWEVFDKEDCRFGYRDSIFKRDLKGKVLIGSITLSLSKVPLVHTSYGAINDTLKDWGISEPTPADVSKAVVFIRESKLPDPSKIGNAGSFFKNPIISLEHYRKLKEEWTGLPGYDDDGNVKVPAGWLIEQCNWKGKRIGEVGVHKKQALVLVNYGDGKGQDILQLSTDIRHDVKEKFDIDLTPEVNII